MHKNNGKTVCFLDSKITKEKQSLPEADPISEY